MMGCKLIRLKKGKKKMGGKTIRLKKDEKDWV